MQIKKEIKFEYGHRLFQTVDQEHKCHRLHGHTAIVTVEVEDRFFEGDMIIDFDKINGAVRKFDHFLILNKKDRLCSILKEVGEVFHEVDGDPTCEYLSRKISHEIRDLLPSYLSSFKISVTFQEGCDGGVAIHQLEG